ncbi:hypothetical protein B0H14DRAFT_3448550 [Mycena olivaceomarginata]|nr:hypothetical protein B0H14DRAFT_3448550 [Mycena olivaceomarginata]
MLQSHPRSFFRVTRNLFLSVEDWEIKDAKLILSRCRGIENLWLSAPARTHRQLISSVARLPLKRFYGHLSSVLACRCTSTFLTGSYNTPRITRPSARNTFGNLVQNIPHTEFHPPFLRFTFIDVSLALLRECLVLRLLILMKLHRIAIGVENHPDRDALANDPRLMTMECNLKVGDWQIGTHMGRDHGSRAEDFITKRRTGLIDTGQ